MVEGGDRSDFIRLFFEGVEHFNRLEFWEAHESWEDLWLVADESNQFLQGLIQMAAAYHHVRRGTFRGAIRLFDAALRRLEPYPPVYCGVDRENVVAAAQSHRTRIAESTECVRDDEFPKLSLIEEWTTTIPSRW
ncbi:MAG TPA: DUF309 domain-containing protein [Thermoanaerobaculia bacterium]